MGFVVYILYYFLFFLDCCLMFRWNVYLFVMPSIDKPKKIHSLDSIRVIAEYLVVRHHILFDHVTHEHAPIPIGVDIMSLFFVLSGFVLMYQYEHVDLITWKERKEFWWGRVYRVYPMFLFNWLCWFPTAVKPWLPGEDNCWVRRLCPVLQLFMLDSWFGCGVGFIVMGVSWFLSCVFWLWFVFPFVKDPLSEFFSVNAWFKMAVINIIWSALFYLLWGYDIYTLSAFPPLRINEFVIGCGAALNLKNKASVYIDRGWYWILLCFWVGLYLFEQTKHGIDSICLYEDHQHNECSLWNAGQKRVITYPPCLTVFDKILNKTALMWAFLLHGVARMELTYDGTGWVVRVLSMDIFKVLNCFSLSLYLGHLNMGMMIAFILKVFFGWEPFEVKDDVALLSVYFSCYILHHAMKALITLVSLPRLSISHGTYEDGIRLIESEISVQI